MMNDLTQLALRLVLDVPAGNCLLHNLVLERLRHCRHYQL
jgi:hypothetical protein